MMKNLMIGLVTVAVIALAGWALVTSMAEDSASIASTEGAAIAIEQQVDLPEKSDPLAGDLVTISEIMERPEEYNSTVRLVGLVAKIDEDQNIFVLSSGEDAESCAPAAPATPVADTPAESADSSCSSCAAPLMLPVRPPAQLPALNTRVRILGQIRQINGKYIFTAHEIEYIRDDG
jgi:hypothetical protein